MTGRRNVAFLAVMLATPAHTHLCYIMPPSGADELLAFLSPTYIVAVRIS